MDKQIPNTVINRALLLSANENNKNNISEMKRIASLNDGNSESDVIRIKLILHLLKYCNNDDRNNNDDNEILKGLDELNDSYLEKSNSDLNESNNDLEKSNIDSNESINNLNKSKISAKSDRTIVERRINIKKPRPTNEQSQQDNQDNQTENNLDEDN